MEKVRDQTHYEKKMHSEMDKHALLIDWKRMKRITIKYQETLNAIRKEDAERKKEII
jgi:hypothetical protein